MSINYTFQEDIPFIRTGVRSTSKFGPYISEISFFLYLAFVFFGTSLPFRERPTDINDIITSNVFNQWCYSVLYVMAALGLTGKFNIIIDFIKREKWLTFFLGWALVTVLWSEYSFVSFKRWLQIAGAALIFSSYMINKKDDLRVLSILKTILGAYVFLSALSIGIIPEAVHADGLGWKGLAPHKNIFGQSCLVSIIVWGLAFKESAYRRSRWLALFFVLLSTVLLVGSKSITSLVVLIALGSFYMLLKIKKVVLQPMIGDEAAWGLLGTLACIYAIFLFVFPEVMVPFFDYFNKDMTLTGRTDLWARVLEDSGERMFLGWGIGGFWVVESPWINHLYHDFPWFPNQSHLGYLDIVNETGLVGGGAFLCMVISYFRKLKEKTLPSRWLWFLITAIILNLTESSIFRTNTVGGSIFLISYIALFFEGSHRSKVAVCYPKWEHQSNQA